MTREERHRRANDEQIRLLRQELLSEDGNVAQQRAAALGIAGENIAYGSLTPQEAVAQVLTSPEHCMNLMDPHWTLFGGGVANGTVTTLFGTYWVQMFGTERR
ncbi:CAP domain-containing protein [uncultured Deinococcus sp.]|uniref:CAP domain-containing protein n=1 Tax=uncultured Deinococcus sp. TaxID=158789 RepID=UPI0025D9AB02|nr:CAP domain-containing protein [uncultured Deinococcus sp.]